MRALTAELAAAHSTIASMASSLSWRVTWILRRMKSLTSRRLRPLREALDGHPSSQNPAAMESGKRPKSSQYGNFAKRAESGTDLDSQAEQSFFDPEFYLKLYPDVRELFHGDPYEHFVAYGRAEGRLGFPPPF